MIEAELTHAGVFEGIGGFSEAARRAGVKTLWVSESDNYKQNILKQHFPEIKLYGKIQRIENPAFAHVLSGGFPCPDISAAGNGAGITGHTSGLWSEMYRIAEQIRPYYIIGENSSFLIKRGFEYVLHDLSAIGYNVEWTCIQANWFGHRHLRKRIFFIAYPMRWGTIPNVSIFRSIPEVLPWLERREGTGQAYLPGLLKRFDRHTDTSTFRANTGFSTGLDKAALHAIGDSVNVDIAHYLFECIKIHATS